MKIFLFFKLFRESYLSAFQSVILNKLRTILSLLGITIGIFAVISVFTVVDSLENSIRESIKSLGNNVLFIQKWPWDFGKDFPWWKYINRPVPSLKELAEIQKRSQGVESAAFAISTSRTVKYLNSSVENSYLVAITHDYGKVMNTEIASGRYFSIAESNGGKNVAIIGNTIAESLFGSDDPLNKIIKISGRNVSVIGIMRKNGDDNFNSTDEQVIVPVNYARNLVDINDDDLNPFIVVKAKKMVSNEELTDELTGLLRSVRRLKPSVEEDFAINESSMLTKGLDDLFSIIRLAGWFIGGFSLLVGGFGIANIMFVSVKERTHLIGIQKSIGAKNYFILLEFLFEAVFLCVIGGVIGLLLVLAGSAIASKLIEMNLFLTAGNVVFGITISITIGLIAGVLPAYSASRLNPVDAIRTEN